ncbi:hypothetical protein GR11A_00056 [Vibrio phage vB_VcorM_GR11A]|nr:hypothetical protein GR11A_00056 [Vibrio phage vB_VcorM_GR11A]
MDSTMTQLAEETYTHLRNHVDLQTLENLAQAGDFGFLDKLNKQPASDLGGADNMLSMAMGQLRELMVGRKWTTENSPSKVRNFLAAYYMWKATGGKELVASINGKLPKGMDITKLIERDLERATLELRLGLFHRNNYSWGDVFDELS